MELGKNVRKKREELGLALAELSAKLGISIPMMSAIELGSKTPGLPLLMLMSEVLGESLDSLCKGN